MNKFKKIGSFIVCVVLLCSMFVISANAVNYSVDLVNGKKAAYSDSYFAYGGYINDTTTCHKISLNRMRAQFEYRKPYSLNWISDVRIFVNANAKAPYTESSKFSSGKNFRLALSPETGTAVSGTGRIYFFN